jgi:predicted acyl esterase
MTASSWRQLGAIVLAAVVAGCGGSSSGGSGGGTRTPTHAATSTATSLNTPTATSTAVSTDAPTATRTATSADTPTVTHTATSTNTPTATPDDRTVPATFRVNPGVRQVTVTGAAAKQALTLVDATGKRLITLIADTGGNATFANIPDEYLVYETGTGSAPPSGTGETLRPGDGYIIRDESERPFQVSEPFHVLARDEHPPVSLYERQTLNGVPWQITGGVLPPHQPEEGVGYLEMRDGTTLSAMVRFPDPRIYGDGPYPTVIELSGYDPSNPADPEPGSLIAQAFGYATVGVNLRGTGCSGGVFDVFSAAEQADGYDLIEIVARQPWVLHNHVGMIGLSYSGIAQLYAGSTQPPSLAGLASLSVIEDAWQMSWPGGVYNAGFTKQWLLERERQSSGGQGWALDRIRAGDTECEANQALRDQSVGFEGLVRALQFRPADADDRDLSRLVTMINRPVFLTGAWQDEQTGPRFATMLGNFTGPGKKRFVLFNGHHPDGYAAHNLSRWYEFLALYVAERVPRLLPVVRLALPAEMEKNFGVPLELDPDRFADLDDTQYAEALARWEADPAVTVDFEVGMGDPEGALGAPVPRFSTHFDQFPPADVEAWRLYLDADGRLADSPAPDEAADRFTFDAAIGMVGYAQEGAYDFIKPAITLDFDWQPTRDGKGLSYLTAPLEEDVVIAGSGHADLWLRSESATAGIELVLSEVTPDGDEVRIQNGILNAGFSQIDEQRSDDFIIQILYDAESYTPVPLNQFVELQVPIFPVAHPLRAGSRLRVQINTPGGDLPLWFFENADPGGESVGYSIGRGGAVASSIVLPVLPAGSVAIPAERPICGALRGQPCRPYVALENAPG